MNLNRQQRRNPAFKKLYAAEQSKQTNALTQIPRDQWAAHLRGEDMVIEVWRSKYFLVQVHMDGGFVRISVNRTALTKGGKWQDGITWDELQAIKCAIGRGEQWAVECFPADSSVINVANLRHLWILDEPPPFAWLVHVEK